MNIELQVGKRYETRGGRWIAGITGRSEAAAGTNEEFLGYVEFSDGFGNGGRTWRADGRFSGDMESVSDLIRELPDASSTPEPAVHPDGEPVRVITDEQAAATLAADRAAESTIDTQAPLRLEVDKRYLRRDGLVVLIQKFDSEDHGPWKFLGDDGSWYSAGGGWAGQGVMDEYDGGFDLIEKIPAPVAEAAAEMEFETGPVTATDGPATEKVVAHWDRERFIGIEAGASTSAGADDTWLRTNLADTRAGIARKYAQAAMFVMLGVAAIVFAIGSSVQA